MKGKSKAKYRVCSARVERPNDTDGSDYIPCGALAKPRYLWVGGSTDVFKKTGDDHWERSPEMFFVAVNLCKKHAGESR